MERVPLVESRTTPRYVTERERYNFEGWRKKLYLRAVRTRRPKVSRAAVAHAERMSRQSSTQWWMSARGMPERCDRRRRNRPMKRDQRYALEEKPNGMVGE